ncbi:MAG: hypothetical protein ABIQ06_00070 [Caldimonas sp.]
MPPAVNYPATKFLLTLEGKPAGFLSSISGGEPFAKISEVLLATGVTNKRVAELGYEPITFDVDLPLEKPVYDWLNTFLDNSQQLTSGFIAILDNSMIERRRLEWDEALITRVTFPAVDAASKDRGQLQCVIQPTRTRRVESSGARVNATPTRSASLVSNFRFALAGLEAPAAQVSRIEPLVVRQPVATVDGRPKAGTLEIPAVKFLVAANSAGPLFAWFDDFVMKGHNAANDERNGSLLFLGPQLKDVLLGVLLKNLGIVRVSELRDVTGGSSIERVRAELYCEQMQLSPATPAAPPG